MSTEDGDPVVTLLADFLPAYLVGFARYSVHRRRGDAVDRKSERKRTPFNHVDDDGLGACAELAVCKLIGAVWTAELDTGGYVPDIRHRGVSYEVKVTTHANGHLIVYPHERVDVWVLVVADRAPRFRIAGWVTREEAARAGSEHASGAIRSRWVPQSALHPLPAGGLTQADVAAVKELTA